MFKTEPNTKFKIVLNKELKVKHMLTTCKKEEVKDVKLFKSVVCYLKFNEDLLQFEYNVERHQWQGLSNVTKSIWFEKVNSDTYVKTVLKLPIVYDEPGNKSAPDSDYIFVKVEANFKNVLLNMFSEQHKEFKLIINYTFKSLKHQTTFHVIIPTIEQTDWDARRSKTPMYWPPEVVPFAFIKLFKTNFSPSVDCSEEEAELRRELLDYIDATTKEKFNKFDFLQTFKEMVAILDLARIKEMEDFSLTLQRVTHFSNTRNHLRKAVESRLKYLMCPSKMKALLKTTYIIEAPKKLPNDTEVFHSLYATDMQVYQQNHDCLDEITDQRILGKIHYIFGNLILFQRTYKSRHEARRCDLDESRLYHIQFQPNRIAIRVAHQAIDTAINKNFENYLEDFNTSDRNTKIEKEIAKFEYMNPFVASNKEQKSAVKNIFNCTSFPSPYIIFGPPGTGKSTTIVEAIAQIVKLKPNARILVTAGSNSACDDVGNRLLKYVSVNKVLRLYSPAFDKKTDKLDKDLQPISNFRNNYICRCKRRSCPEIESCDDPSYEEFYTSRVIVATLVNCGRIFSAGIKPDHFNYIFIDEAASQCEQHTLVPIVGLGATANGVTAQIVLSGDHKQLGPIVPPRFCCKMGMEKSMMERIMETNVNYQRGLSYNQKYVTQLVKNYRSHPAILQFSNENFYDSKLEFKCQKKIANFACDWDCLPNKDFPLLFHTTRTLSTEVGLSLMNEGEVNVLNSYIKVLLLGINGEKVKQSDIGIISPYRAQRDRMLEQFGDEYPKIEIGTVDSFQGREKKIIIMSTVRSGTSHVGFLKNEKRLNVALTRAKCLLIIIGNSATLQKCLIWKKFIVYCDNNSAIIGDTLSIDQEVTNDQKPQENEDKQEETEDSSEDTEDSSEETEDSSEDTSEDEFAD